MPKRIGNTLPPRNPVTRAMVTRRGGAHQPSRTGERQQSRLAVDNELDNWRDDLEFEQNYRREREEGSDSEPSYVELARFKVTKPMFSPSL